MKMHYDSHTIIMKNMIIQAIITIKYICKYVTTEIHNSDQNYRFSIGNSQFRSEL